MSENKFILTGNASYENKGCEAIIRGTVKILDGVFGGNNSYIAESRFLSDKIYKAQAAGEYDERIKHVPFTYKRRTFKEKLSLAAVMDKISHDLNLYGKFEDLERKKRTHKNILNDLPDCTAVLCAGGDNYSLDYGLPRYFTDTDDVVLSHKKPCIIWGASVGPFRENPLYEKFMAGHLKKVTAIFAREDVTIEYLDSIGVNKNVYRVSDPAFLMEPVKPDDFDSLEGVKNGIGINLSPLMAKYWANGDLAKWKEFCIGLVKEVKDKFNLPVCLIPHVVHENNNNDYVFLKSVKENIANSDEWLFLLSPGYTAAETKYIIGSLKCFIGARTHSAIAAFSGFVPTISLAYSIKAMGINKEVYGDLSYCVSPGENANTGYICGLLGDLVNNREDISLKMRDNYQGIRQRAEFAGYKLREIIS